ncbi:LytTR family DNA-binding domain-containing protein [Clostridium sp. AM58-1XD]|uniref:LytR/AlgR family response regulator transcription factor n=1 Tax=Clostridium sp. AM58-1XD TaxID=2292307 RepID=UPI000E550A7B|nr:LytTR family DNA-binding domain-containing protein [Clostridium sp. AM58-1XD]RGY99249.1 DNA-binding response regulator [Clostridium sp. AM58-1XD]
MRVAICDDEKRDGERIGELLTAKMKKRGEVLRITYFDGGEDLIEQYESEYPGYDLIFMDIFLKRLNGMDTVRRIRQYDRKVTVIFLTFSADYAMEGYEVNAFCYLLKPINPEKVEGVINRFMEERHPRVQQSLLMVNGSSGRRIAYDDIMYIESQRMKLRIVCSGGVVHIIRKKLAEIQAELPEKRFLRCNQSFIVNMDYVTCADVDFTMDNGDRVPIKVRERKKIRETYFAYTLKQGWEGA